MGHFFRFSGHPSSKQQLTAEGEDAAIAGIGAWPKDAVKEVGDDVARFLRVTRCFVELTADDLEQQRHPAPKRALIPAATTAPKEPVTTGATDQTDVPAPDPVLPVSDAASSPSAPTTAKETSA